MLHIVILLTEIKFQKQLQTCRLNSSRQCCLRLLVRSGWTSLIPYFTSHINVISCKTTSPFLLSGINQSGIKLWNRHLFTIMFFTAVETICWNVHALGLEKQFPRKLLFESSHMEFGMDRSLSDIQPK